MAEAEQQEIAAADLERSHRLEQRARSFRIRRDRYLEPISDPLTFLRSDGDYVYHPIDEDDRRQCLGFPPPIDDFFMIYRAKDGDYENLQRFAKSLVRFGGDDEDSFLNEFSLLLVLALPHGGVALISWLGDWSEIVSLRLPFYLGFFSASHAQIRVTSLDKVTAVMFISQCADMREHDLDFDDFLTFMTSLLVPEKALVNEFELCLDESLRPPWRNERWGFCHDVFESAMESLVSADSKLHLNNVPVSESQLGIIESMPFRVLEVSGIVLGFLPGTRAKHVILNCQTYEQARSACYELGSRQHPIDMVEINVGAVQWETMTDVSLFAYGLGRVANVKLSGFSFTATAWTHLWATLRQNKSLRSLEFVDFQDADELNLAEDVTSNGYGWIWAVHDCLDDNWFLESIQFPDGCLTGDKLEFWNEEVAPLLKLNASHRPRLFFKERSVAVIHDAIIRVRSHPSKIHSLLKAYPFIFVPRPIKTRLAELEQQRRQDQESLAMLRATVHVQNQEITEQRNELARAHDRIASLEDDLAELRSLVTGRRVRARR